ncbi:MAG: SDR family oxidoreductase [Acidimicrobiia bacterium]|nr:SDR family oxidoreductase [Acidimicrobiia bacterium]
MPSIELANRRVLVLGGSGVLGSAIAQELAARSATVMLAGRDADRLRTAAAGIGPDVPSVLFDLRQPHHADHVVDTAIDRLGGLDGIVNAAGVVAFGPLASTTDETIDAVVETDFLGPLRVMHRAIDRMDGGFFVHLTGVVAERPMPGMAVYSAAKAGLSAASAALAKELRRDGFHVLDARPPHTETGLASRPVEGSAPAMSEGLDPLHVARVVVEGLQSGARELPAEAFAPA